MERFDSVPKYRMTFMFYESRMKADLTIKCELPGTMKIAILETFENVESSINSTF
jgi:hypothetical protein